MISVNSVVQKSKDHLMSMVDKEAVILGIESGKYVGLNEIGTEIWVRLEQPVKVSSIIKEFVKIYDEQEHTIRDQVIEFLALLYDKELIQVKDDTQS